MRVTSALFVSAYIRRCNLEGAAAALVKRGAEEAGAIFVSVDRLDGTVDLYAPAPQTAFDDRPDERLFQRVAERATPADVEERLSRERRFDPDLWVVAVEDREGRCFLDLATG
ncbi:MAG: DUF1491 family protein [Bauldia sp.]|nr:DUF1491 family protein [Bauldia sp.]